MQSTMPTKNPLLLMTPAAFERYVRGILKREKFNVQDLVVNHLENVEGSDGDYVMDVLATFTVLVLRLSDVSSSVNATQIRLSERR